jgi:hypothetical protein
MTEFIVITVVLLLLALLLRHRARRTVGKSTRPHHIVYADTGQNGCARSATRV